MWCMRACVRVPQDLPDCFVMWHCTPPGAALSWFLSLFLFLFLFLCRPLRSFRRFDCFCGSRGIQSTGAVSFCVAGNWNEQVEGRI
jgi:hypothetical protein